MIPFIWLGIAAVMAVIEMFSWGLITMWFVIGALAAFAANLLGGSVLVQLIVFLVVSIACLVLLRPVCLKYRNKGQSAEPTYIGINGVVVELIDNNAMVGRVELPDHMTWSARSADGSLMKVGELVRVVAQESAKLIVERK